MSWGEVKLSEHRARHERPHRIIAPEHKVTIMDFLQTEISNTKGAQDRVRARYQGYFDEQEKAHNARTKLGKWAFKLFGHTITEKELQGELSVHDKRLEKSRAALNDINGIFGTSKEESVRIDRAWDIIYNRFSDALGMFTASAFLSEDSGDPASRRGYIEDATRMLKLLEILDPELAKRERAVLNGYRAFSNLDPPS